MTPLERLHARLVEVTHYNPETGAFNANVRVGPCKEGHVYRYVNRNGYIEISFDGKHIHLGSFSTAELAHQEYVKAKRQYHTGGTL